MTNYIFIESRDPFESRDTEFVAETAAALVGRDHEVTIYLVQNGVFAARATARDSFLNRLEQTGARVLADDFSLRERGIGGGELRPGVRQAGIETLALMLAREDTKAIWH